MAVTPARRLIMILTALTAGIVALLGIQALDLLPMFFAPFKLPIGILLVVGLFKLLRSPLVNPRQAEAHEKQAKAE